jgi:hypothetical protein
MRITASKRPRAKTQRDFLVFHDTKQALTRRSWGLWARFLFLAERIHLKNARGLRQEANVNMNDVSSLRAEPEEKGREGKTHWVRLGAETCGYVGGVMAFAALFAMAIQSWEGFGVAERLLLPGLAVAACLPGGWVIAAAAGEGSRGLGHFLMFLGVGAFGILAGQGIDLTVGGYDAPLIAGGLGAVMVGIAAWWRHRTSLQLVAVALAIAFLVLESADDCFGVSEAFAIGAIYTLLGCLWHYAGDVHWVCPTRTAWIIGYLKILAGVQIMVLGTWHHAVYLLLAGCMFSILMILTGLGFKRWASLGFGIVGILVFGPQTLSLVFKDLIGTSSEILLAAVLLVGLSALIILVLPRLRGERGA